MDERPLFWGEGVMQKQFRRMIPFTIAAMLAATSITIRSASALAESPEPQPPAVSNTEPSTAEVSAYRKTFPELSVAQAEASLSTQHRGVQIVSQLEHALGPDYAGVWLDPGLDPAPALTPT